METRLTTDPSFAARFIRDGGIVAFPTETVYGLGANVFDEVAVRKIFDAKMRPADNPLITHVSDRSQIQQLAEIVPPIAQHLIDAFFPGPLTLVLPKSDSVPLVATAGLDTIGIRMPSLDVTRRFLEGAGCPVCAPSANLSGRPSPTTWRAVYEDLNGRIDCILQGDQTEIGIESTVVDCTGVDAVLLRQGAVSMEQLLSVDPHIRAVGAESNLTSRSPGLRHKHYAPRASVMLIDTPDQIPDNSNAAYIGLSTPRSADLVLPRVCSSVAEYARSLFEFFRECDRMGIKVAYCQVVPGTGIGAALMDRLERAAER